MRGKNGGSLHQAAADGEFDAAFCDTLLIHAGAHNAALSEMA